MKSSIDQVSSWKEYEEPINEKWNQFGCSLMEMSTSFRVWAPKATKVRLILFDGANLDEVMEEMDMKPSEKGTWFLEVSVNYQGKFYQYEIIREKNTKRIIDPYSTALSINGIHSYIIKLPPFNEDNIPERPKMQDIIIYEVHIRDLTAHPSTHSHFPGRYLGFCEKGTSHQGYPTGIDHIRELGVTHLQILPFFQFASVDERKVPIIQKSDSVKNEEHPEYPYNWGYDPLHWNVPSGVYALDPSNPLSRVNELREMIKSLHQMNLFVVMDVVYNHVFDAYQSFFHPMAPFYCFRYQKEKDKIHLSNGSGCGNDIASERKMIQKMIVDSVVFWAKEYHIDGFRFDLMGLLDVDTMNDIRRRLDSIDPLIITYGEGWQLHTALEGHSTQLANQKNIEKMPNIAQFNDFFRDSIKGSVFDPKSCGLINGKTWKERLHFLPEVKRGISGHLGFHSSNPSSTIQYVECHDNWTLFDKLCLSTLPSMKENTRVSLKDDQLEDIFLMHRVATSIILLSQGIPFIHAGQEFFRTKQMNPNSYNSPIEINWLDWDRRVKYNVNVEYIKEIIQIRKNHPAFRMPSSDQVKKHLHFHSSPKGTIVYTIGEHANGDAAKYLVVIHNYCKEDENIKLPFLSSSGWQVLSDSNMQQTNQTFHSPVIHARQLTTLVLQST